MRYICEKFYVFTKVEERIPLIRLENKLLYRNEKESKQTDAIEVEFRGVSDEMIISLATSNDGVLVSKTCDFTDSDTAVVPA